MVATGEPTEAMKALRGILVFLKIVLCFFRLSENRSLLFEIKRISEIAKI